MKKTSSLLALAVVSLAFRVKPAGAQPFCDPSLVGRSDSPTAYREREGRCEGIYAQQVGTVSLGVRSLVESFGPFDPSRDTELVLAWTAPPGIERNVKLRAFSFRPRTYFRMDTAVLATRGEYRWPTNVLASERLIQDELGIVAWVELPGPGGSTREVYLPLRVGRGGKIEEIGHRISIVPSERLDKVHVSVSRLDAGGGVAATLKRDEELGFGYYPSGKPTDFSTGNLGAAGFYRIEVTATPKSGSPVKESFEIYHAGH